MKFLDERNAILEIGKRLYSLGLVAANDGNISVRLEDGSILCTPTGVSKGFMKAEMLPILTPDGEVISAKEGFGPSSEVKMHLRVYELDSSVNGVVHAHPPFATAFAVRGETFDAPLMAESVVLLPRVPLAPYATPSTSEVPDSISDLVIGNSACLLEHHGALSWGHSVEDAMMTMERLEHMAKITSITRQLGGERLLTDQQIARLTEVFNLDS